jgi:hypothetical protein
MTIEELEDKHSKIIDNDSKNPEEELFEGEFEYWLNKQKKHIKLSIQFAIEVLEDTARLCLADRSIIEDKIQELKEHLNEEV